MRQYTVHVAVQKSAHESVEHRSVRKEHKACKRCILHTSEKKPITTEKNAWKPNPEANLLI
jgi:hypothetical protein